jgi:hypothetical protein
MRVLGDGRCPQRCGGGDPQISANNQTGSPQQVVVATFIGSAATDRSFNLGALC